MTKKNDGWRLFLRVVAEVKDEQLLDQLFQFFFTAEEREHLATRTQLVEQLIKGEKTQREIAKDLQISIAKITRGSNNLKEITTELKRYLQQQLL